MAEGDIEVEITGMEGPPEAEPEIRLSSTMHGDEVVGMVISDDSRSLLTLCENGYGKRTELGEYRLQTRGGQGLIDIRASERNGPVVNMLAVDDSDEVMLVTKDGQIVRTPASGISTIGRATQGVRCIQLRGGDKLVAVAKVPSDAEEDGAEPEVGS